MINEVYKKIKEIDASINKDIEKLSRDTRSEISQNIVAKLRHLCEHLMVFIYGINENKEVCIDYKCIKEAINYCKQQTKFRLFTNFHLLFQESISHYLPNEDSAERLMLKYYEFLYGAREFVKKEPYCLDILENIEKFPLELESQTKEYYEKIASKISNLGYIKTYEIEKYKILKTKPFFVNGKIYYENIITLSRNNINKSDHSVVFSKNPLPEFYSLSISIVRENIEIENNNMPIVIVCDYKISIKNNEFDNFSKLFNGNEMRIAYSIDKSERNAINNYLTEFRVNLLDIVLMLNEDYENFKNEIKKNTSENKFLQILDICRDIILNEKPAHNILRYLLFTMHNVVIKNQFNKKEKNQRLSDLYIINKSIPFDNIPFNFSLKNHNPSLSALVKCIDIKDKYKSQLFARIIENKIKNEGMFINLKDLINDEISIDMIGKIINDYNASLWEGHKSVSGLQIDNNQIYRNGIFEDCIYILNRLNRILKSDFVLNLDEKELLLVDCNEKKVILNKIFKNSNLCVIYGAAGTGKTTLLDYISKLSFFENKSKIFLAQTNSAIDNLKKRIKAENSIFMTIEKFKKQKNLEDIECELLVIDECSIVNNEDFKNILLKENFNKLILVGDVYQIEAIKFGNFFKIIKDFLPSNVCFELTKPYRTDNSDLIQLWKMVRELQPNILEFMTKKNYLAKLDKSIFKNTNKDEDEIILCLNYDGLFGINNINRFLQKSNPQKAISWGINEFKINDPVLFSDISRFRPYIYNGMKGKILNIDILDKDKFNERIVFDIKIDKITENLDNVSEFEILDNTLPNSTTIRFSVFKNIIVGNNEEEYYDEDKEDKTIIPFQIAYAMSIHKAQGLEYSSVKIVITDEVDELITHNIFYTAITRAKDKLKIYWSAETGNKILKSFSKVDKKDVHILRNMAKNKKIDLELVEE